MQEQFAKELLTGSIAGAVLAVVLIISVVATGNTFGQLCANEYSKGSLEWRKCVSDMSKGKGVDG